MQRKQNRRFDISTVSELYKRFNWFDPGHYEFCQDDDRLATEILRLRPIWRYVESVEYPDPCDYECPPEFMDWQERIELQGEYKPGERVPPPPPDKDASYEKIEEAMKDMTPDERSEVIRSESMESLPGMQEKYALRPTGVVVSPLTVGKTRYFTEEIKTLPSPKFANDCLIIDDCPIDSLDDEWAKNRATLVINLEDDPDEIAEDVRRLVKIYAEKAGIKRNPNPNLSTQKSNRLDQKVMDDARKKQLIPYIDLYLESCFRTLNITDNTYANALFPLSDKTEKNIPQLHQNARDLMLSNAQPIPWIKLPHKAR